MDYKKELRAMNRAYAAFLTATALFVSANAEINQYSWIVLSLLAISIPSVIAYSGFARLTAEDKEHNPAIIASISMFLAYVPSILAISILFSKGSIIAALIFPLTALAWFVAVVCVRRDS